MQYLPTSPIMPQTSGCNNLFIVRKVMKESLSSKNPGARLKMVEVVETRSGNNFASSATSSLTSYRATVMVNDHFEEYCVVCKKIGAEDSVIRELSDHVQVFQKEVGMYRKLIPFMEKFQLHRNITPISLAVPKCYGSECKGEDQYIILENLGINGFRSADSTELNYEEVVLSVQELAKMHAIGHALISVYNNKLFEMFPFMRETVYREESFKYLYYMWTKSYDGAVDIVGTEDPDLGVKMTKYQNKVFDTVLQNMNQYDPLLQALCHGDFWFNNILFLYDQFKHPVDIRFVDFQLIRVGSVTTDLTHFLYTSTTSAFRKIHYHKVLQIYFERFRDILQHLHINISPELTFDYLLDKMKKTLPYAVAFMAFAMPMQLHRDSKDEKTNQIKNEVGSNLNNSPTDFAYNLSKKMRHPSVQPRLLDFYQEMAELGVI